MDSKEAFGAEYLEEGPEEVCLWGGAHPCYPPFCRSLVEASIS